jgi:deazaflavin-dependent oxidoreductase (nitroreductase family)
VGDTLALIGTNFAEARTPSWVHNLLVHPQATLTYRGSQIVVTAREVTGAEYEQIFAAAALIYPGYGAYRTRLTNRVPKVFVLHTDADAPT